MTYLPFSQLSPSIPIILIPAGVHTSNALDIVQKASREPFRISARNQSELLDNCANHNIPCPQEFWAHFIPCYSISDYFLLSERLNSEKCFYFYQFISVIILVDYTVNKSVEAIQENYSKIINKSFPTGYFIYRSTEDIMYLFSDTTCISFDTYSKENVLNHIHQFAYNFVIQSISKNSIFMSNVKYGDDLSVFPIKTSLACVASDIKEIIPHFRKIVPTIENFDQMNHLAAFCELCGSLERIFPGFIKQIKISDVFNIGKAPWCDSSEFFQNDFFQSDLFQCLSTAGYLYYISNNIDKCMDCGLRCIACGFTQLIPKVSSLIQRNSTYPMMKHRALEFIALCNRLNLVRKAALFEYTFVESLQENDKISHYRHCLNLFKYSQLKEKIQYEIVAPMILYLKNVEPYLCAEIISEIFTNFGSKLPLHTQESLFQSLSLLASNDIALITRLCLKLINASIETPQCFIRPLVNSISKSSQKSVFLYSSIKSQNDDQSYYFGKNQQVKILIEIENKFQIPLPFSLSASPSNEDDYYGTETVYVLQPFTPTLVPIIITANKVKDISINSIKASLFGLYDIIDLHTCLNIHIIDEPVIFSITTSLPLNRTIEYFKGEDIHFSIWISNQGEFPIHSISTDFRRCNIQTTFNKKELPLESMESIHLECKINYQKKISNILGEIKCTSENHSFESVITINQPINIIEGLIPSAIYPLVNQAYIPNFKNDTMTMICIEIENVSDESFYYTASFDASPLSCNSNFDSNDNCNSNGFGDAILSCTEYHGFIGKKKKCLHLCPISQNDIKDTEIAANDPRVIMAARDAELKFGLSRSMEDRKKIIQLVNLQIFLEKHLSFHWISTNSHKGVLPINSVLPDISFLQAMNQIYPSVSISYLIGNEEYNEIITEQIVDVCVDFNEFLITKCSLDIEKYSSPEIGLIWDGKLTKLSEEGLSCFTFRLCFMNPGKYEFPIYFSSNKNGIVGSELAIINVISN
ncbi:hypothetical protein TRFO_18494 [Tritrichomonas foetus]|uniref:Uncharacterized protein n=1 Tax=Tritrichomonas foetus TaxID=1144522 RepID=A0A1J4KR10_9EUKA|nr:hypothetical protein TRFO_18494 [Tritrichomonas foetus]|eukprot:OHT11909.1 hypothetical protein TRFO_18494 [Tritrichomonas foetus]